MQVLMFSIRRHSSRDVEFCEINNTLAPEVTDPRYLPYTNFSFGRFAIPKLKEYKGKAIYLDSDMLVFRDIAELWNNPFNKAKILTVNPGDEGGSSKKTAVMLMGCEQLPWDPEIIIANLGDQYDYQELMSFSPLVEAEFIQPGICYGWNCLDTFNQETRLLHYMDITTQPWVSVNSPWRNLWVNELGLMINENKMHIDEIESEVTKGHIRPSLLHELGFKGEQVTAKEVLQSIDDSHAYEPHKKLYLIIIIPKLYLVAYLVVEVFSVLQMLA